MSEHLPDVDQLPNVKLTPEQDARAASMAKQMTRSYVGSYSAARVIVSLQDENKRLKRPPHEREPPHCSSCSCGMPAETTPGAPPHVDLLKLAPGHVQCPECFGTKEHDRLCPEVMRRWSRATTGEAPK